MADLAAMSSRLDPRAVEQVKQQYEGALLKALEDKEKAMDDQMKKLESMDEDDFEKLREKRKIQMQKQAMLRQKNLLNGHGRYMELSDQKEFFDAAKTSKMVVCHFFRSSTLRCQYVDRHLGDLAPQHLETRFVKIDAEKSPFLVERLQIVVLPSILCIKDGKTEHTIVGFDEMGGADDFSAETLAYVLAQHKVLKYDGPAPDDADEETGLVLPKGANSIDMRRQTKGAIREGGAQQAREDADDDDDDIDAYLEGYEEPTADDDVAP